MNNIRRILLLSLIAAGWARPGLANDAVSFRLNWYPGGFHTPFCLGLERGYYREQGIDLTINPGRGSANTVQVVAAGTDTFGLADSASVMLLASKGADVKTVMSLANTSSFGVISLAETGIRTPKDLEGKSLAITPGDALTQLFPAVARRHELDMSKIRLVQIDPAAKVTAVLEKRVDALLGGLDDQFFLIRQKGFNPSGMGFAANGANTVGLTIFTVNSLIEKNPGLVKRFVAATQRAWVAAKADPDAAVAAELKSSPDLNAASTKDQLLADLGFLESPATKGKPIGWGSEEDWKATQALLVQYRDLKTDKPASAFFTNEFLP
jgi:NitT/TauT family transport system substrate-binding protein